MARALASATAATMNFGMRSGVVPRLVSRLANLSEVLRVPSDRSLFRLLMSPNRNPLAWLQYKEEPPTRFDDVFPWDNLPDLLHRMMHLDFVSYLPDDILVKVDRAAMAVSLETRIPLLDHCVIEYAWRLPSSLKQRRGCGKYLLRRVLHQYVPPALVERPKHGFSVPIAEWLRGPLRPWAEALLSPARLRQEGYFDDRAIRQKWMDHLDGKQDLGTPLWHVLIFQAWLELQAARANAIGTAADAAKTKPAPIGVAFPTVLTPTIERKQATDVTRIIGRLDRTPHLLVATLHRSTAQAGQNR